jgi:CRISPR-associated protein Cmr3
MNAKTTRIALRIEPLDVLFFRDGRPFGEASHGTSGLPLPQTLAGALRTALLRRHGCDFEKLATEVRGKDGKDGVSFAKALGQQKNIPDWIAKLEFRGPWLADYSEPEPDVFVPMPAILHKSKGSKGKCPSVCPKVGAEAERGKALHRLAPLARGTLPGFDSSEPDKLRPLWLKESGRFERAEGFLNLGGLKTFLAGETPRPKDVKKPDDLYGFDRRTGIGVDPESLSAKEGLIYGASFLALKECVGFYAEVEAPEDAAEKAKKELAGLGVMAFGGEGRRARISRIEPVPWPEANPSGSKQKPLVLLTTPGLFRAGWKPAALNGQIAAAAVPGSLPLSGWDLAKGGPKPARFAAMAGSVYFLDALPGELPNVLADQQDEDGQAGYGCFLKGVWTDE